jgi:predicted RNA-binding protein associated with RNAse of E/G family
MRTFDYQVTVTCVGDGEADLAEVENLISLSMQDLVVGEDFTSALDETVAVAIEVTPLFGKTDG